MTSAAAPRMGWRWIRRTMPRIGVSFFFAFAGSAAFAGATSVTAPVPKCEIPPTPEWALRDVQRSDAEFAKKFTATRNTFPAKIAGKDSVVNYTKFPSTQSPSKGTIVFLGGGPGMPWSFAGRASNMPADYDILVMDYLGVGDNKKFATPEMMAIDSQGAAVAQMIEYVNPKNVILYGHSFGTTVATVAASQLTNPKVGSKPSTLKGVFLEGVVGKASTNDYEGSFARSAEKAWSYLSSDEKENVKTTYRRLSTELNAEERVLLNRVLVGGTTRGVLKQVEMLKSFPKMTAAILRKEFKSRELGRLNMASGESLAQLRAAGCQILSNQSGQTRQKVFDGVVEVATPVPPDLCKCRTVAKDWDPDEYQIKGVPVLYVNGKQDPNTAYAGAKAHFDGQKKASSKVFLGTELGGHQETFNFPFTTCMEDFFDNLAAQDLSALKRNSGAIESRGCQSGGSLTGANVSPGQK